MNWTKNKSAKLSLCCIAVFAVLLFAADLSAVGFAGWYARVRFKGVWQYIVLLSASIYLLSVPAWICLVKLWKLMKNVMAEEVFTDENVKLLRGISWCCAAASVISLLSGLYYLPFMIIAISAAFMMLIVRVVKNAFRQAIDMKSELDLTI